MKVKQSKTFSKMVCTQVKLIKITDQETKLQIVNMHGRKRIPDAHNVSKRKEGCPYMPDTAVSITLY